MPTATPREHPHRHHGYLIATASILSLLVMMHHPTHYGDPHNGVVHGILAALLVVVFAGFLEVAAALGWHRPVVQIATATHALAVVLWVHAALVNGFVAPALAEPTTVGGSVSAGMLALCQTANRVLAHAGALARSTSIVAWSLALSRRGRVANATAAFGLVTGGAATVLLLTGHLQLDLQGAQTALFADVAWTVGVAMWLGIGQPRRPAGTDVAGIRDVGSDVDVVATRR